MTIAIAGLAIPAAKLALGAASTALGALKEALSPSEQKTRKTADDFESMYLENMMAEVFPQESGEGPLGDNGAGSTVYRGMMVNEMAKSVAKSGGIGVSDTIYRQMLQMQERSNALK